MKAVLFALILSVLAGCATAPAPSPVSAVSGIPDERALNLFEDAVPSDRVLYVWDRSEKPDAITAQVAESLAGLLAERGYKVMGNQPNVLIELRATAQLADDFGGGRVYGGSVQAAVFAREGEDAFLLGSQVYPSGAPARGRREFDDLQARRSALEPLVSPLVQWVHELCSARGRGLTGTRFRAAQAFRELDAEIARYEKARDGK